MTSISVYAQFEKNEEGEILRAVEIHEFYPEELVYYFPSVRVEKIDFYLFESPQIGRKWFIYGVAKSDLNKENPRLGLVEVVDKHISERLWEIFMRQERRFLND